MSTAQAGARVRAALVRGLIFFSGWLLLANFGTGAALAADLAVGLASAGAATWVSLRLLPAAPGRVRYGALGRLLWRFLWQSIVAGVDVARRAFALRPSLQPGELVFPVRVPAGAGRALFGAFTSLVPGTLPVGAGQGVGGRAALVYHCLDLRQPVAAGLAKDEALMLAAYGEDESHD